MPASVPLRRDFDARHLRKPPAGKSPGRAAVCCLLRGQPFDDGMRRWRGRKIGGMDRQTLRDRFIRFNEEGPDGLTGVARARARTRYLSDVR